MLRKSLVALVPLAVLTVSGFIQAYDSEFWCPECNSLPGSRTYCKHGKQWPLAARPNCPSEPAIHRYHTAHYWPDPYRWQDRGSVREHVEAQRAAGWVTATTLYEQHFDANTHELNQAGRNHLRWILLHVPPARRMPWVQAGDTTDVSQARLASVHSASNEIVGGPGPAAMLRVCQNYGGSAEEADLVRRAYRSSMPSPRIQVSHGGGGDNAGQGAK